MSGFIEMDDDGYPTEEALETVRKWPAQDALGLFNALKEAWIYPDYIGLDESVVTPDPCRWLVSTGGWSGHEDLIGALQSNTVVWLMCWQSSKRGGHFEFEIPAVCRRGP